MASTLPSYEPTTYSFLPEPDLQNSTVIELISGSFTKAIQAIWGNHIIEYLTAPDVRRHVWHAWIAGKADADLNHGVLDFLRFSKSKDIIADAYGSCPFGYLSALKRLGTKAREPRTYQSLFAVLAAGGHRAKLVHHAKEIDDETIINLASVPNDEFSTAIVSRLIDRSVDAEKFCGAVWIARQLRSMVGPDQVINAVSKSSNPMKTLHKLVLQMQFPEPPFKCRSPMVPVGSVDEAKSLARKFDNCLTDFDRMSEIATSIQSGLRYLYHWDGEEPALILIERFAALGWVIEEARGVKNRPLGEVTLRQIEQVIDDTDLICPAWPHSMAVPTRGWFFE